MKLRHVLLFAVFLVATLMLVNVLTMRSVALDVTEQPQDFDSMMAAVAPDDDATEPAADPAAAAAAAAARARARSAGLGAPVPRKRHGFAAREQHLPSPGGVAVPAPIGVDGVKKPIVGGLLANYVNGPGVGDEAATKGYVELEGHDKRDGREEKRKLVITNVAFEDMGDAAERAIVARGHREPVTSEHRVFKVATRKDFQSSIAPGMLSLGMRETNGADWNVYWGGQWPLETFEETFLSPQLARLTDTGEEVMVATIPAYEKMMGSKPAIAALHSQCLERMQKRRWDASLPRDLCAFTMPGFNFKKPKRKGGATFPEGELERFYEYGKAEAQKGHLVWVLKPKFGFMNDGIRLMLIDPKQFESPATLKKWAGESVSKGDYTLQQFVSNPLTYHGRKWDMRVWVLVTSIDPLRVYVMEHGFPKISTVDYNLSKKTLHNNCMHITMPLGEGCKAKGLVKPYPKTTSDPTFPDYLRFATPGLAVPWEQVWEDVGLKLSVPLLLERSRSLEYDQRIEASGLYYRRFAVLSPDVIINDEGKAIVEEINTNGFMVGDRYPAFWKGQLDIEDAMLVLGVNGFDRSAYSKQVTQSIDSFCLIWPRGCTDREKRELWRLEDETRATVGRPFRRVFPAEEGTRHEALSRVLDSAAGTDMDLLTWSYLRFSQGQELLETW